MLKKGDHVLVLIIPRTLDAPSIERRTISQVRAGGDMIAFTLGLSLPSNRVFKDLDMALTALEAELRRYRDDLIESLNETEQMLVLLVEKKISQEHLADLRTIRA